MSGKAFLGNRLLCVALALFSTTVLAAQPKQDPGPAPIPVQILTARRVFISNAGTDAPSGFYSYDDPNLAYNRFYAGIKDWGHFELTTAPADADLVFEIGLSYLWSSGSSDHPHNLDYSPRLRLSIVDPKTRVALWTLLEDAPTALLEHNRDKNFERAMATLLKDTKNLFAQKKAPTGSPKE